MGVRPFANRAPTRSHGVRLSVLTSAHTQNNLTPTHSSAHPATLRFGDLTKFPPCCADRHAHGRAHNTSRSHKTMSSFIKWTDRAFTNSPDLLRPLCMPGAASQTMHTCAPSNSRHLLHPPTPFVTHPSCYADHAMCMWSTIDALLASTRSQWDSDQVSMRANPQAIGQRVQE